MSTLSIPAPCMVRTSARLTLRGRRLVTMVVLAAILVVVALIRPPTASPWSGSGSGATSADASAVAERVTVRPGQTLWEIAVATEPQTDPRTTVSRIKEMNGLSSSAIEAGRVLLVPAG